MSEGDTAPQQPPNGISNGRTAPPLLPSGKKCPRIITRSLVPMAMIIFSCIPGAIWAGASIGLTETEKDKNSGSGNEIISGVTMVIFVFFGLYLIGIFQGEAYATDKKRQPADATPKNRAVMAIAYWNAQAKTVIIGSAAFTVVSIVLALASALIRGPDQWATLSATLSLAALVIVADILFFFLLRAAAYAVTPAEVMQHPTVPQE